VTPARVEFLDMPGYASSDKYFADARTHQALIRVVRAFESDSVPHQKNRIDWKADLLDLDTDFVLQDLAMVERRIEKLAKDSSKPTKNQKQQKEELAIFERVHPGLEEGLPLRQTVTDPEERQTLGMYGFLTLKPTLTLINLDDEADLAELGLPPLPDLERGDVSDIVLPIKARLEAEVAQLDDADRAEFLADFGLDEPIRERLIRLSYALLGLQSFLTAGPKEVRAWTVRRDASAVDAARVIHTDIARGFIRAEVVGWEDYLACGGWKQAKASNKHRLEGKDYRIQDGDILDIRHGG